MVTAAATALTAALLGFAACGGEPPAMIGTSASAGPPEEVGGGTGSAEPEPAPPFAGAVLQLEDLDAALGDAAAPAVERPETEALPPELARVLFAGPGGAPPDAFDLVMGEQEADALPLVLGSSTIVDDTLGDEALPDPTAPAAEADLDTIP